MPARADDYGPHKDIRDVTFAATRLLAHRLREAKIDPLSALISDVVVVHDQTLLTWHADKRSGVMGLVRYADRWWDALDETASLSFPTSCAYTISAFPLRATNQDHSSLEATDPSTLGMTPQLTQAALSHNALLRQLMNAVAADKAAGIYQLCHIDDFRDLQAPYPLSPKGDGIDDSRDKNAGYELSMRYSENNSKNAQFRRFTARAPSPGEIIGYPTPPHTSGGSTGVVFLYIDVDSKAPVSFEKGSKISMWVPYVLDDQLDYELELYTTGKTVGPIKATIFDNVLTFDLPAFTLPPGETQGEVDGYW